MFDRNMREAYQKVQPSAGLRNRVLQLETEYGRPKTRRIASRRLLVSAACFAILLGTAGLLFRGNPSIRVWSGGTPLSEKPAVVQTVGQGPGKVRAEAFIMPANAQAEVLLLLEIDSGSAEIHADQGILFLEEAFAEDAAASLKISGKTAVYWKMPEPAAGQIPRLYISARGQHAVVTVEKTEDGYAAILQEE